QAGAAIVATARDRSRRLLDPGGDLRWRQPWALGEEQRGEPGDVRGGQRGASEVSMTVITGQEMVLRLRSRPGRQHTARAASWPRVRRATDQSPVEAIPGVGEVVQIAARRKHVDALSLVAPWRALIRPP